MFVLFQILILFIFICKCPAPLEKGCRMSLLDSKMAPLTGLVGLKSVKWPENENELKEYCRSFPALLSDTKDYVKKCAKGEAKTLMNVVLHSVDKMNSKSICKINTEKRKLLASAKCGNKAKKESVKCWSKWINVMSLIKDVQDNKLRIPLLCCSSFQWSDCLVKSHESMGEPTCTNLDVEYFEQYAYKSTVESLNIFCADYGDSDKCEKIFTKIPKFDSKVSATRIKYATPFPWIIDIFESL